MLLNKKASFAFKLPAVVFIMLINFKMPTIVGILTFINRMILCSADLSEKDSYEDT